MRIVAGMTSEALTPLIHMTNHCHKTVSVNESLILDLTENLMADRVLVGHLSCAVTLQAEPGARLYLHVLQLAISDKANMPDRYMSLTTVFMPRQVGLCQSATGSYYRDR